MNRLLVGSAHGRFQPLHNGHLEYLLTAKSKCDFLWIGITQFNIRGLAGSPMDRHREQPINNPLTYFERLELITQALMDEGIGRAEFGIVPFPIETPDLLPDFIPTNIPVFTTICEDWNRHKIRILEQQGYRVIVLWERVPKDVDGAQVRDKIRAGDPEWMNLVPPATVKAVQRYALRERLNSLNVPKEEPGEAQR